MLQKLKRIANATIVVKLDRPSKGHQERSCCAGKLADINRGIQSVKEEGAMSSEQALANVHEPFTR
ncbi:MAG TPA: hypothetical protein VHV83_01265 [Armatimonadota bacterium]|nr:hypothetical protein [Armatimonadota bacterium]